MAKRPRKTLTREDWLRAALDTLEESGLDGVRILPLAKRIGASRGSFYWHFRDRGDLLRSLLDHWDRWSTRSVIKGLSSSEAAALPAKERIWFLMDQVISRDLSAYDPAIRAWARHDPEAAKVVRRVDRRRLATVTGLFREAGFSEEQAEVRARLLAVYLIANGVVFVRESAKRRRELARLRWELLVEARSEPGASTRRAT